MNDRKKSAAESSLSKALSFTAIAIAAVLAMGAAAALVPVPSAENQEASTTTTYAGPSGYFPDQFVNQAKEIEPMPQMYE
jgi:hypothetical protein